MFPTYTVEIAAFCEGLSYFINRQFSLILFLFSFFAVEVSYNKDMVATI